MKFRNPKTRPKQRTFATSSIIRGFRGERWYMGSGNVGVDPRLLEFMVCPRDRSTLRESGRELICEQGHAYGIVDGVPVLLGDEVPFTHSDAQRALAATRSGPPQLTPSPVRRE